MYLLSIDPGLARSGYALWDASDMPPPARRSTDKGVGDRLLATWDHKTSASLPLDERLREIANHVYRHLSLRDRPTVVVIERPSAGGTGYSRNRGGNNVGNGVVIGVTKVSTVVGVMMGVCVALDKCLAVPIRVDTLGADNKPKFERWRIVSPVVADTLRAANNGKLQTNKEKRDAIWLGYRALTDGRRKW